MTEDRCGCCDGIGRHENGRTVTGERNGNGSVLEARLPEELREALGRFLGVGSVETLGEWADHVRRRIGDDPVTIEELCLVEKETEHWGILDGDRYHFRCFYDAVILAAMSDRPVDIRTQSPDGTVIRARAIGGDRLTVVPDSAVFSFGIDGSIDPPKDGPSIEDGYGAICPYVKAFPTQDAYTRWETVVPAATIPMSLDEAIALAAMLVRENP